VAEIAVVKEQLTDAMVEAGAALTHKLDQSGIPIVAAFWLFVPDINEWRLLFASPDVATLGPLTVYKRIWVALADLGEKAAAAPFSVISLLDPNAELVLRLKTAIHTGAGIERIRLSKNVADGHYIEDALIYRAT
jgi:hypothetical protein